MEENAAMLNELCQRAAKRHITLYSRFLNLAQQREGEIAARRAGAEYCLYGGAQDCERRMLAVSGEDMPDESLFPIACLLAAPRSARFAAPIAHRDVLGALMGLGIERELIGDIVLREAGAYIFCVERRRRALRTAGLSTARRAGDLRARVWPGTVSGCRRPKQEGQGRCAHCAV